MMSKIKRFVLAASVGAGLLIFGLASCDRNQSSDENTAQQAEEATSIVIALHPGNKLTAKLTNAPLSTVAKEVSRTLGVGIVINEQQKDKRVTLAFEDLPLKEGLVRIFGPDANITYPPKLAETSSSKKQKDNLANNTISRLPNSNSLSSQKNPLDQLIDQALNSPAPNDRIQALKNLVQQIPNAPDKLLPVFESALQDSDAQVRKTAIDLVLYKRIPIKDETIHDIAVNDDDDEMRGKAWVILTNRASPETLKQYLPDALSDPNPAIKNDARKLLEKLESQGSNG
ncbi:MAG: hypothetical protein AXA67_05720 [Methylothermaceae bacteria B42]|nr:MAG: hypothetical protein AXA67_05720 [Methylothermaceae bacteria B42]HHJ38700.1 HEAT repeat domain-containing protein [Methylothermaceae bacterium]